MHALCICELNIFCRRNWPWWKIVLPTVACAITINLPKCFEYQPKVSNGTCSVQLTDMGENPNFLLSYVTICSLALFLPILPITILSILTFKELRSLRKRFPASSSNRNEDLSLAVIGLLIAGVYTFCTSLVLCDLFYISSKHGLNDIQSIIDVVGTQNGWLESVCTLSTTFSSSANFYIYTWKYWRKVLVRSPATSSWFARLIISPNTNMNTNLPFCNHDSCLQNLS